MNLTKISFKKTFTIFALVATLVLSTILPAFISRAAVNYPTSGKITLHKLIYEEGASVSQVNATGKALDESVIGIKGTDYNPQSNAKFNLIEVKDLSELGNTYSPTQDEAAAYYAAHSGDGKYTKRPDSLTDTNGLIVYDGLPATTYLIYETTNPAPKKLAAPIVVTLPMMDPSGASWNNDVHVYTKALDNLGAAQLYKYRGEMGPGTPTPGSTENANALPGALFNLYQRDESDKIIQPAVATNLSTGLDGYTPIIGNLPWGKYAFVETSAPDGYLNSGKQINIEVTQGAYDGFGALVQSRAALGQSANFLQPKVDKKVLRSTTFDIGQVETWAVMIDIPANYADYTKLVISDIIDPRLTYAGKPTVRVSDQQQDKITDEMIHEIKLLDPNYYNLITPTEGNKNTLTVRLKDFDVLGYTGSWGESKTIIVTFDTLINNTASAAVQIPNSATLSINNGFVDMDIASFHTPTVVMGGTKFKKTDNFGQPLANAKFKIYRKNEERNEYMSFDTNNVVSWSTTESKGHVFTSDDKGLFELYGVAYGNRYYLEEVEAPEGFNLLKSDYKFNVDSKSYLDENTISIMNSRAFVLPITGGIGTAIFFMIGGTIMVIAVVAYKKKKTQQANK